MEAKHTATLVACLLFGACAEDRGNPVETPLDRGEGDIECLPAVSGQLAASSTHVLSERPVTLSWSAPRPPGCGTVKYVIVDVTLNEPTPVSDGGTLSVKPLFATRYRLFAVHGTVAQELGTPVDVTVELPKVVYIRGNDYKWRQLLAWSLGAQGRTIRLLPNVDMDLTKIAQLNDDMGTDWRPLKREQLMPYLPVVAGVTLTGDLVPGEEAATNAVPGGIPPSGSFDPFGAVTHIGATAPATTTFNDKIVPGRGGVRAGPRLYRTRGTDGSGQFNLRCFDGENCADDVTFSGFRLQGPQNGITDSVSATGIVGDSVRRLEVSNMEIAGWSSSAISGRDQFDRIADPQPPGFALDPNGARIHDNYIHHNQNDQLGYGTVVSQLYGKIERNVYDNNRHAIAGNAPPGNGYLAQHNLILKGGGYHGGFGSSIFGYYDTHQIDVHGTDDCGLSEHNCGDAGTFWRIRKNAVQYARDSAVSIRGKPAIRVTIDENVFAYDDEDDAIELDTHENVVISVNVYHDSYSQYATCDFDGDGRDDLFLATRRSWWYSSGGTMPWVWLSEKNEDLRDIAVGYFDGDRKCDLVKRIDTRPAQLSISSGGVGGWRPLPVAGEVQMPWSELRFVDMDGDGTTDIFERRADGSWWVRAPNSSDWRRLGSSGAPIRDLRFARLSPNPADPRDHQRDANMDIIRLNDGRLQYSRDGRDAWQELNLTYEGNDTLLFGDLDGNGQDDIVRYVAFRGTKPAHWVVSWGGAPIWSPLNLLNVPLTNVTANLDASLRKRAYFGKFDVKPGLDLLFIDGDRYGHLYSHPAAQKPQRYSYAQY